MKKWIDYSRRFVKNGLISKDQYGDWCVPPEDPKLIHSQDPARITDKTLLATALLLQDAAADGAATRRMLGKAADAAEFDRLAAAVTRRLPTSRFFKRESSSTTTARRPRACCRCASGWCRRISARPVVRDLVAQDRTRRANGHVGTGLVGAQWLMRMLSDNGRADLALHDRHAEDLSGLGLHGGKGRDHDLGAVERQYRRPGDELRQPRDADRRPGGVDVRVSGGHPHGPGKAGLPAHPSSGPIRRAI